MRNIALIGGIGSGKTTLADALRCEVPDVHYVYMSKYNVRIPMTLIASTQPDLLSLPKIDYIETIFENEYIPWEDLSREEMDDFLRKVMRRYGETIIAEVGIRATRSDAPNLLDNVLRVANVRYIKEKGFYVVGLHCKIEIQVQRRLEDKKEIDPVEKRLMEQEVSRTNTYYQIDEILNLADIVYDTDEIRSDFPGRVKEIIQAMQ